MNIIIMTIYGVLCGYTDFVNMADFLELNKEYFITLLNLENGIPSHDTFSTNCIYGNYFTFNIY